MGFINKTMVIHNTGQGIFFLVICFTSLITSAPGGNPGCQVDGSREPVCDGSGFFFPHESDCGKYWDCGPDLQPCLFDCPAISEDVGGGTLFFNPVISACDWPVNVDCQTETGGCCELLNVVGEKFPNGEYMKSLEQHNGRAVYQHTDGEFCIFYGEHWKIENCNWLTQDGWSQGYGWSDV